MRSRAARGLVRLAAVFFSIVAVLVTNQVSAGAAGSPTVTTVKPLTATTVKSTTTTTKKPVTTTTKKPVTTTTKKPVTTTTRKSATVTTVKSAEVPPVTTSPTMPPPVISVGERPATPSNVVARPGRVPGQVDVTWTPADSSKVPVGSQIVWLYAANAKLPIGKLEVPYWYTSLPLIRLKPGMEVAIGVTAVNDNGWGPESARSNLVVVPATAAPPTTTVPPTTAPPNVSVGGRPVAPTNVVVTGGSSGGSLRISWTPADTSQAPVTSQIVWLYSGTSTLPTGKIEVPYWYTSMTAIRLPVGVSMSAAVTAVNGNGWSAMSLRSGLVQVP